MGSGGRVREGAPRGPMVENACAPRMFVSSADGGRMRESSAFADGYERTRRQLIVDWTVFCSLLCGAIVAAAWFTSQL